MFQETISDEYIVIQSGTSVKEVRSNIEKIITGTKKITEDMKE